jgi:hypothetical protein
LQPPGQFSSMGLLLALILRLEVNLSLAQIHYIEGSK